MNRLSAAGVVLVSWLTACGVPYTPPKPAATEVAATKGTASTTVIGAAGGTLKSPDARLELKVPAGALSADTTISVQPLENVAPGRIGDGFRLLPEGTTFAQPVTLTFTYDDAAIAGSAPELLGVAFQNADRFWQWVDGPVVDTTAKTVKVTTTHFSDWSLVEGMQIRPPEKSVATGGNLELRAVYCYAAEVDGLVALGFSCSGDGDLVPLVPPTNVQEWQVNGITNGNNSVGRVSGTGATVTYVAPESLPSKNPVAVSAKLKWGRLGTVLATANVTVGDARPYVGTLTFTKKTSTTDSVSGTGNLKWIFKKDTGSSRQFTISGSLTADFLMANCEPVRKTFTTFETSGIGLNVFSPETAVYGSKYFFAVTATSEENVVCNGTSGKRTLSVALSTQGCASPAQTGVAWTTMEKLEGSFHCEDQFASDLSWSFALQ